MLPITRIVVDLISDVPKGKRPRKVINYFSYLNIPTNILGEIFIRLKIFLKDR